MSAAKQIPGWKIVKQPPCHVVEPFPLASSQFLFERLSPHMLNHPEIFNLVVLLTFVTFWVPFFMLPIIIS